MALFAYYFVLSIIVLITYAIHRYKSAGQTVDSEIRSKRLKSCSQVSLLLWISGAIVSLLIFFKYNDYCNANFIMALIIGTPIFTVGIIKAIFGLKYSSGKSLFCWIILILHNIPIICFYLPYQRLPYYGEFWLATRNEWAYSISLEESNISNHGLRHLNKFQMLHSLYLSDSRVTDAGLIYLENLKDLRKLTLNNTRITDAGLIHIRSLEQLTSLYLSETNITDAGLVYLENLKELGELQFRHTAVSSKGMVHLKGLKNLWLLDLGHTKVDDSSIEYLATLENLKSLRIWGTNITEQGVELLKKALPNCEIHY